MPIPPKTDVIIKLNKELASKNATVSLTLYDAVVIEYPIEYKDEVELIVKQHLKDNE